MTRRLFVFGCSYTSYAYPTWADYIGVNFDKYYNYGAGGSSNTYIMNKLVEANEKHVFDSNTDEVIVMITGFGRFSYMPENSTWVSHGDLYSNVATTKNPILEFFLKNMWSEEWAVYQSWIATKIMKNLLVSKNIKHKFLMGIDNSAYRDGTVYLSEAANKLINEIYEIIAHKKSLDEWKLESTENQDTPTWKEENRRDGHPSYISHYKYTKEHFSEFMTSKSQELKEFWDANFDYSSQNNQGKKYNLYFRQQYDLAIHEPYPF